MEETDKEYKNVHIKRQIMKKELQKKLSYYEIQLKKYTKTYISDMKRGSRDMVVKTMERIQTYQELIEIAKD